MRSSQAFPSVHLESFNIASIQHMSYLPATPKGTLCQNPKSDSTPSAANACIGVDCSAACCMS